MQICEHALGRDVRCDFASDNYAGAHPAVLEAVVACNAGHEPAYGGDRYTARAEAAFRAELGDRARIYFALSGTGANVVALASALRPHQAVICAAGAHIDVDECGAYERFGGGKIVTVATRDGKLTADDVERASAGIGDQHRAQPAAISISQSTEAGTVYGLDEMQALAAMCRRYGLLFHVDGARIANAAVALGASLRSLLVDTGVDVCSFGGTKNGLLFGEAIVFPRGHSAERDVPFVRKQAMQLGSKMRFVAAQFEALLANGLWQRNAANANAMAQRLAARVSGVEHVGIVHPVQANAMFCVLPVRAIEPLQRERRFYVWDRERSVVRWMTAWDTTESDVDDFSEAIVRIVVRPEREAPHQRREP